MAAKKSAENIKYGEDLMEALELCEAFREEVEQYEIAVEERKKNGGVGTQGIEKPVPSVLFNHRNIFDYILLQLKVAALLYILLCELLAQLK